MPATLLGALATAGALGFTHAIEPDHVAGISSLTTDGGKGRLPALIGACFSLGHVVLVVAWLVVGYLVLGRTEFPPVLRTGGTIVVAVVLGVLGCVTALRGIRAIRRSYVHDHDGDSPPHPHLGTGRPTVATRAHDHVPVGYFLPAVADEEEGHAHGILPYLATGLVGASFTLSPPVSMIVFATTLFSTYDGRAVVLAVLAYAVGIVATMSLVGAGVGVCLDRASASRRRAAAARAVVGVAVTAVAGWTILGLL